ncbi:MAG: RNA-binding protein [Verrucomicrobiae bacterium]|nr:RNA-binding protein [Verrucomicrobiae bacterium]
MGNRLYVGNLSYHTTQDSLRDQFAQAGTVSNVDLIMDKFTGRSRGFAFVEMATDEEAKKAIELFHGKDVDGRALTVNEARPREERAPRSGGGGGFGGGRGGGGGYGGGGGRDRGNRY